MPEDDVPWTSIVIAPGGSQHHGRDPRNLTRTLCGEVEVTHHTLHRGCFYGTHEDDCGTCSELLPGNHY